MVAHNPLNRQPPGLNAQTLACFLGDDDLTFGAYDIQHDIL
jgi:hypothetical protein